MIDGVDKLAPEAQIEFPPRAFEAKERCTFGDSCDSRLLT